MMEVLLLLLRLCQANNSIDGLDARSNGNYTYAYRFGHVQKSLAGWFVDGSSVQILDERPPHTWRSLATPTPSPIPKPIK